MPIRRLSLPATLFALVAMLFGLLVSAPPATASSTILCKGFSGCKAAGYQRFGYPKNYTKSWWRMYAGHNCTNYVAYRMVRNGMPAERPWSGSGDARNWGNVFASRTDQTPIVGSVAWWSTNHVAYVQQVIDANTIVISEDHWGGDFDWRRIVRAGGGWPTGFIHLTDEGLSPTAPPTISGTPKVDVPLATTPGSWNLGGATYSYQWYANGVPIPGATGTTYTPTASQVAAQITVQVGASRFGYRSGSSSSAATAAVAPGTMRTTAAPTVTGLAKVGGVLTASGGSFDPAAVATSIAWLADGVPIPGANQWTLALGPDQLYRRITAVVTGQRPGYYDGTAGSAPTAPIGPEKLVMTQEPALAGEPHLGRGLAVQPGVVGPDGVTTKYRWMRDGVRIKGARDARYVPTVDDLGAQLSLKVRYAKPGYTSIVRILPLTGKVQARPRIRVTSQSHREVTVRLVAEGVANVKGRVTLVNVEGARRTVTLQHGRATFSPKWLDAGRRTFTVIYEGSPRVDARTRAKTLRVR